MKLEIYVCDKCGKRLEAETDTIAPLQKFGYNGYDMGSFCLICADELAEIRKRHEKNHYEDLCKVFPDATLDTHKTLRAMVKLSTI